MSEGDSKSAPPQHKGGGSGNLGLWLTFAAAIFGGIVTLVVAIINHQSSETKVEPKPPPATTTPVPAATVRPTPIPTATPTAEPTLSQLTLTPVFPTAEVKINGVAYSIAPIGRVAINSSEDGEFIFPLPKGTRSAALEFWYRGESETINIDIPN